MNTWDTNTEWFVVKCNSSKELSQFLNFTGKTVSWSEGINHFIGSEKLVLSNSIEQFLVLGGSNIMDIAFESIEQYMSFKNHEERLKHMIKFLNKLSQEYGEAYFFQTHDHHMINIGLFKSLNGTLIYGKAEVDCDKYEFANTESIEIQDKDLFDIIESWTFNPMKIETQFDVTKLNWIEKEHTSMTTLMLRKMMGN